MQNAVKVLHITDDKSWIEKFLSTCKATGCSTSEFQKHLSDRKTHRVDIFLFDIDSSTVSSVKKLTTEVRRIYPNQSIILLFKEELKNPEYIKKDLEASDYLFEKLLSPELLEKTLQLNFQKSQLLSEKHEISSELENLYDSVNHILFRASINENNELIFDKVNQPFSRVFNFEPYQAKGQTIQQIIPDYLIDSVNRHFRKAIENKTKISWQDVIRLNQRKRNGQITVYPFFDDKGKFEYLLGSVEDVTEINKAVTNLQFNRILVEAIFDHSLNAILIIDDLGNVISCNQSAISLFHHEKNDLTLLNMSELRLDKVYFLKIMENLLSKNKYEGEIQFLTKNDELRTALFNAVHVRKNFNIFSFHDISKRVEFQEEIKKLSLIAKETINAAIITDKNGRIIWVNSAFERMSGYLSSEVKGKIPGAILQGKKSDRAIIRNMLKKQKEKEPFTAEIINYKKDGSEYWVRIEGQPIFDKLGQFEGYFALETDISDRIAYENQIIYNKKQLDLAVEAGNLAILDWNFKNGYYEANEIFFDLVELSNKIFLPSPENFIYSIVHPDDREQMENVISEMFDKECDSMTEKFKIISGFHKVKWVKMRGNLLREEGNKVRFISVLIDITHEVEQEQEIMKATLEAQEKEKKRLSHEIHDGLQQTILTAKLNFESAWSKKDLHQKRYETGLQYIEKAITEARELSHTLIPMQLNEYGVVQSIHNLIEATRQDIDIIFFENLEERRLDKVSELSLFRIVQEAINNILKHSNAKEVFIQLIYTPSKTSLTIEDDGKGFYPEEIKNGYGLSSMRNRALSIRGRFEVHSSPGKGSFISVEIPEDISV